MAVEAIYPKGVPNQATVPNKVLVGEVQDWLKSKGMPKVSRDTIFRAVGRRSS